MPSDLLFRKLCDPATIEIGWHLAHGDSRDDFATDPLGYADYAFLKKERFQFIVEQLRHHRYRVARVTDIDIPKTGLSVRPGNVLPIEESTILHAIVYLLAPKIDSRLKDGVYSYRLAKDWENRAKRADAIFSQGNVDHIPFLKRKTIRSISLEEPWYVAWPEFDAESIRAVKEKGYTHLTKTDITAYFENIELSVLEAALRSCLRNDPTIIEILMRILHSWTRRTPSGVPIGRGIPQGNDVSSFLGNLFLMPLDEELHRFSKARDAVWFRYVDDVKVFTKSFEDAREAVFLINGALRRLHLNLQGSKTEILEGHKLVAELHDPKLEKISSIIETAEKLGKNPASKQITRCAKEARGVVKEFTRGLPASVSNLSGKQSRLFRRCLTLFRILRRPQLQRSAIQALCHLPDVRVLRSSLSYLIKLPIAYHETVFDELLKLLQHRDLAFPYQVATTIEAISQLSPKDPRKMASQLRQIGFNKQAQWYVRQKTIEAVTRLPYLEEYAERLANSALIDDNPWVRRAGAMLVVRGRVNWVRDQINRLVYHADSEVSRVALFWKRHLDDVQTANQALANLRQGSTNDQFILRRFYLVYLLRCSENPEVGKQLIELLSQWSKIRNPVLRWHCKAVSQELEQWVK